MKRTLTALTLLFPAWAGAAEYAFAHYGSAALKVDHPYITDAQTSAAASSVGIGLRLGGPWSAEFAFHDLGTYRFTGEKEFTESRTLKLGPFTYDVSGSLALPGYAEIRAYGQSAGVKYTGETGLFAKGALMYATAEATLHTPVGYRMVKRAHLLPLGEIGWNYGKFNARYLIAPKMRGAFIGVQVDL